MTERQCNKRDEVVAWVGTEVRQEGLNEERERDSKIEILKKAKNWCVRNNNVREEERCLGICGG